MTTPKASPGTVLQAAAEGTAQHSFYKPFFDFDLSPWGPRPPPNMKVSVILPTYNRAYILPEAVDSVISQTYADWELIIVDDGSTDDTAEVVAGFNDPRIRFVQHPKNLGVAAAQNTALAHSRGEMVAFFASDDLWKPEKLHVQVKFLDGHPESGGVFSDLEWIVGGRRVKSMMGSYPAFCRLVSRSAAQGAIVFSQRELYLCLLEEMPVKLQATILRRERVHAAGIFEGTWRSAEDWELLLRFTRRNALGYIDRPLAVQRTMSDSTLGRHKKQDAQSLMERFIREEQSLRGDAEALAAVRRGIAKHARELGSCCLDEGDRGSAFRAYSRGFAHSGDPKLLARCAGAMLPRGTRELVRRVHKGMRNGR